MSWQEKLTTRNILAVTTAGVFNYLVYYIVTNPEALVETVKENPELSIAGAVVLGAFIPVVKDVYQFFFRKNNK